MRQSLGSGPGNDRIASQNGVGYFEHCIGKDQEQGDIEGHQRADNVLGLRILPAGGRDRRGHFRIDHGDGRIEQSDEPAGHESGESAALVGGEIPAGELADENDADAERPDMGGAEDTQERYALAVGGCHLGCCLSCFCHGVPLRPCAFR